MEVSTSTQNSNLHPQWCQTWAHPRHGELWAWQGEPPPGALCLDAAWGTPPAAQPEPNRETRPSWEAWKRFPSAGALEIVFGDMKDNKLPAPADAVRASISSPG